MTYLVDLDRPSFVPRSERDMVRGRRMADRARTAGTDAMSVALTQIENTFSAACFINDFKLRVERWLQAGPCSPRTRARFRNRAEMLGDCSLEYAIYKVERWYAIERTAFRRGGRPRLPLEVLKEARLILRWMRAAGHEHEWPTILAELTEPDWKPIEHPRWDLRN